MTERQKRNALARIRRWITTRCAAAHSLYIPMSGGTDSALGFKLLNEVYPEKTVGVHVGNRMTDSQKQYFESVGRMRFVSPIVAPDVDADTLRWALLNSMCKRDVAWLIGTRNRTEQVMGTYSLASRMATIQPLTGVWKAQIMELAQYIGVPEDVLASSRQADPNCGRPPEMAEIGLERIDVFARSKVTGKTRSLRKQLTPAEIKYLDGIYRYNRFKARLPFMA